MPRYRSYRKRAYKRRDNIWLPSNAFVSYTAAKTPSVVKLLDIPLTELENESGWTLKRQRAEVINDFAGSPPRSGVIGNIFGLILPDIMYGNDASGTIYDSDSNSSRVPPVPTDAEGTDDFPIIKPLCLIPTGNPTIFSYDSKGQRRIQKDELLTIFMQLLTQTAGTTLAGTVAIIMRTLFSRIR